MPLSEEISGGINRRLYLTPKNLLNVGTDLAINFKGGIFRGSDNLAIIGGNGAYVGSMADINGGRVTQFATLPDTVITFSVDFVVKIDYNDQSIMVCSRTGQNIAKTTNTGASWSDIGANLRALSYVDIASWRGNRLVAAVLSGGGGTPADVSIDGGASWTAFDDGQPGPGVGHDFMTSDPSHTVLVSLGDNGITTCFADDVTVLANWNVLDANTDFGVTSGFNSYAFNSLATKFIAMSQSAHILTTEDFITWIEIDRDINPFINALNPITTATSIVHIDALNGWLLWSDNAQGLTAFVPSNESPVNTIFTGSQLGAAIAADGRGGAISNGDDAIFLGSNNKIVNTLQT